MRAVPAFIRGATLYDGHESVQRLRTGVQVLRTNDCPELGAQDPHEPPFALFLLFLGDKVTVFVTH